MSELEDRLYQSMHFLSLTEAGFPMPVRQFHPLWCCQHPRTRHRDDEWEYCRDCEMRGEPDHAYVHERDWACDFAWPDRKLIVEVEGGVWTRGRHVRPSGFIRDAEKYNELTLRGWAVLRVTQREVKSGEALNLVERALAGDRGETWEVA